MHGSIVPTRYSREIGRKFVCVLVVCGTGSAYCAVAAPEATAMKTTQHFIVGRLI
jgi:hypothetical protein